MIEVLCPRPSRPFPMSDSSHFPYRYRHPAATTDAAGRNGGLLAENKHYRYDPAARLVDINDPGSARIQYAYDKAGRLIGSRHNHQSHHYAFDAAGNRVNPKPMTREEIDENWAETVRKRLNDPDFNPLAYSPEQLQPKTSRQWIDNRITELDGVRNTYDAAGNLTRQTRPDGTAIELYYDGAFRLTALKRTNPRDGTNLSAWYAYDAFSRRIAKGVIENEVERVTRYGWDGNKLVHEATEETLTTIVYTPDNVAPLIRIDQPVLKEAEKSEREQAMREAMKQVEKLLAAEGMELKKPPIDPRWLNVSFFVTDHAGTPVKLINEEGRAIWQAEPDDWGAVRNEKTFLNSGIRQPIRFQGQWLDEESGFYYNRYRFYDPRQGRYVTQDPIGLAGGDNLYGYAGGNPVGYIDPLGLGACELNLTAGRLVCIPDDPANSAVDIPVASGNNAASDAQGNPCRNNPNCTAISNHGPIPTGSWRWTNGSTGKPNGRVLEPVPGTNTNVTENRTLIRSHSCANPFGPALGPTFCSEGCVTGTSSDIQDLNRLIDAEPGSTLEVVP